MNNKAPEQQSEIKALISKGLEQGYLTYAEINDHLPDDIVDPEQIEDIMAVLKGVGIEVHDAAPDADPLADNAPGSGNDDEAAAEEAVALLSAVDAEVGRTTDPVRMYMREMGTVELLTREGEIAIAKRIEEGLGQVQTALASFPLTIELLLEEYDQHLDGKRRLSEILAGFADLEQLADEARAEAEEAAANGEVVESDEDEDEDDGDDSEEEEAGPTGPDPEEVKRRMELLRDYYTKFQKAAPKATGITDKKIVKLRDQMAEEFLKLKLPSALIDSFVRKLREVVGDIRHHERVLMDIFVKQVKMPKAEF
ncbi:RNA polymerase sigma factor region1.1 domain-containing protein, partial [Frateuria sp.]